VLAVFDEGSAEFVATDGHRLSLMRRKLPGLKPMGDNAIVPTEAMTLIQRLLADEPEEEVAVAMDETSVTVQSGRALVNARLVEGHFPPYRDVIPRDADKKATLNAGQFRSALRQARILTSLETREVRLQFAEDKLVLQGSAAETGEATVEVACQYKDAEIQIGFNPSLLEDALRRIPSDEDVAFEMSQPARPGMLKAGEGFVYVVMPISV
jgi:DNA polymerase-3 subunit beta